MGLPSTKWRLHTLWHDDGSFRVHGFLGSALLKLRNHRWRFAGCFLTVGNGNNLKYTHKSTFNHEGITRIYNAIHVWSSTKIWDDDSLQITVIIILIIISRFFNHYKWNFVWDILRLPSSRRRVLGLHVNLTRWWAWGSNQRPYARLHTGPYCATNYATGEAGLKQKWIKSILNFHLYSPLTWTSLLEISFGPNPKPISLLEPSISNDCSCTAFYWTQQWQHINITKYVVGCFKHETNKSYHIFDNLRKGRVTWAVLLTHSFMGGAGRHLPPQRLLIPISTSMSIAVSWGRAFQPQIHVVTEKRNRLTKYILKYYPEVFSLLKFNKF